MATKLKIIDKTLFWVTISLGAIAILLISYNKSYVILLISYIILCLLRTGFIIKQPPKEKMGLNVLLYFWLVFFLIASVMIFYLECIHYTTYNDWFLLYVALVFSTVSFIHLFLEESFLFLLANRNFSSVRPLNLFKNKSWTQKFAFSIIVFILSFIYMSVMIILNLMETDAIFVVFSAFYAVFIFLFITGLLLTYMFKYVRDFDKVIEKIEKFQENKECKISKNSPMYKIIRKLDKIQTDIDKLIDEGIKSEKLKIDLVTNVSHDLRTPLTSIISYLDLIALRTDLPKDAEEDIKILIDKTDRLKVMIENLFILSKATSRNEPVNFEKINVRHFVKQFLVEGNFSDKQNYKINIIEEDYFVMADGDKFFRILQNIFQNADKYHLAGTRVFFDVYRENEYVFFCLKNTSAAEMNFTEDEVLGRFVRGDMNRTTEGNGLGLSIVKALIDNLDGELKIIIDGDQFKVLIKFKGI